MNSNELRPDRQGRRHERFGTACRARIRIQNRHYAGSLENISVSGARIRTFSIIRDEGPTTLLIPDLAPIGGTLSWFEDKVAGVLFERLLEPEVLGRWLATRLVLESSTELPQDSYSPVVAQLSRETGAAFGRG